MSAAMWLLVLLCVGVALYRLKAGVFLWMAIAGSAMMPLYAMRHAVVYLGPAYLAFLLTVWLARLWWGGNASWKHSRLTVPLLAIATTALLSGLQGAFFYDPSLWALHRFALVQIYAVALVILSVGAAFLVSHHLENRSDLRWMYLIVVGLTVVILSASLVPIPFLQRRQWSPLIVAHGVALSYAILLHDPPSGLARKALLLALVAWGLWQCVGLPFFHPEQGQWISGWLMVGVPVAVVTLVKFPRASVAVLLPAFAAFVYLRLPLVVRVYQLSAREGDFQRPYLWLDAMRIALMRPIFGVGPGNYMDYTERYARVDLALASAHGNYEQIAAEMGFVGLAFVLWLLIRAIAVGWNLFRTVEDRFSQAVALGLIGALAGQMLASALGDYLIPAYHNGGHTTICVTIYTWIMVGALMAIETHARQRDRTA